MSDANTSTSSSSATKTETKPTATASTKEATPGQDEIDNNTAHEDAVIAANQERYDKRMSGMSSAEINEEDRQAAAEENPPEEGLENGGVTYPKNAKKKG
jgi:hypothetical protein